MAAPRHLLAVAVLFTAFASAAAFTDPPDAIGLLGLYHTLESPWQLSVWTFQGGDPCGEGGEPGQWRGVFCKGPSVVTINISGFGVGGWLGPDLLKFQSLTKLDMSFNSISGEIPSTLPPNLEYLNLAANKFEGNIPSSLPWLHSLKYLNLSYNRLSGIIGDVFVNMDSLETMDLSFNAFSGNLPRSFSSLTNLHYLYLHHNEFTGSVILLADLPLSTLNIEKNRFSGYVPGSFQSILELRIDGNHFEPVLKGWKSCPCRRKSTYNHATLPANMETVAKANEVLYSWSSLLIGSETSSSNKDITSVLKIKSWSKTSKTIPTAKQFPAADILAATRNFNEECLIGEGFTGRVYRGEFPDGKLLAIKRIDMMDLSLSEQDELMDMLWNISRLKHPNIYAMRSRALSWKARIKIALGVAYALEYIHLTCSPPVAHGNISPRNILLDAQLMPYLSDSGLTKLSHFSSTARMKNIEALISAKGYAAPELVDPGSDSIRADIYSFGVILLVLLTGQKAFDSSKKQNEQLLVDWATPHLCHPDSLQRITDPRISSYMPPKAISSLGEIILLCIKQSPELRPPMTVIADKLVKLVQTTGLEKTSTTQRLEVDAQDPSFVTTRPYFEPSSTVSQSATESCISR
ncbi:hypothetical protein QOZ80_2BG0158300 [Eleusine coracana subsp. coracana]|nr:hypothetical protein QOZ80_2BG0158300 [Eleusine coracana subsp. coracana]